MYFFYGEGRGKKEEAVYAIYGSFSKARYAIFGLARTRRDHVFSCDFLMKNVQFAYYNRMNVIELV